MHATSSNGKVGVVRNSKAGEFFGEGCIIGQAYRPINAIAMTTCSITRVEKAIIAWNPVRRPELRGVLYFIPDRPECLL
jgi:hypothetical protein